MYRRHMGRWCVDALQHTGVYNACMFVVCQLMALANCIIVVYVLNAHVFIQVKLTGG
jgi:hypothetical protein